VSSAKAAQRYIERGYTVVPVPPRSKNPGRTGWERLRIAREDVRRYFTNGQNIGIHVGEPSGWRVDVDLDVAEVRRVAGRFLEPTLTSGRASSPDSHWWYVCPGAEYRAFKDIGGETILELRSTGHHTLVWPSVHPSGEEIRWSEAGLEAQEIGAEDLTRACRELASAGLIARHLPPPREKRTGTGGGRHNVALALAGFLLRRGLDDLTVLKILRAAWDARGFAGDQTLAQREAHRDLEGIVEDTFRRIHAGEAATGGRTLDSLIPGLPRKLADYWGWSKELDEGEPPNKATHNPPRKQRNQADRLIDYALESGAERFVDQAGAPHVLVESEAVPLNTASYKWLRTLMWDREGISVGGEALKTAAGTLAAFAAREGQVRELHTRSAFREGAVYYRLDKGRVVRIDREGWELEAEPPVLFRGVPNLKPLPNPEPGGSLDALENLVNLKTGRDKRLLKAYAATVALPHVGRPILQTTGVMGSGKTTAGRVIKRAFDPAAPETVRVDPRDFLQKASHAYIVMLDNQNSLPEWAVDTLCRLVTGEGDSKRSLYTDDEDFVYELRRAVLLNGINPPTDRGDAQDRTLPVELDRIPDRARCSEEELWERFDSGHDRLLGAAFDALAGGIRARESLELSRRPRLADWGEYAAGVYEALGWGAEQFLEDWDGVVEVQNQGTLDGSPVAQTILSFMENRDEYAGLASDLHAKLEAQAEDLKIDVKRDRSWPKTPSWLWRRIREVLQLLVAMGIEARNTGNGKVGSQITLEKISPNYPHDGGSKNEDATTDATTGDSAGESALEEGGSRGSNYGHSSPSLSRTTGDKGKNPPQIRGRGQEYPADATTATTATTNHGDPAAEPLSSELEPGEGTTLEQLQRIRDLVRQGMSEKVAREEVLGKGWVEP
jgi:hypothetical protein